VDEEADESAEAALIQAFADFVRSAASGERVAAADVEPLLSIADAARYLNVSTTTVRSLAVGGKVRSTHVGDRIRFRRAWLDEWIDAGGGEVPGAVARFQAVRAGTPSAADDGPTDPPTGRTKAQTADLHPAGR
jgi:excisionase family DNA binding protein